MSADAADVLTGDAALAVAVVELWKHGGVLRRAGAGWSSIDGAVEVDAGACERLVAVGALRPNALLTDRLLLTEASAAAAQAHHRKRRGSPA